MVVFWWYQTLARVAFYAVSQVDLHPTKPTDLWPLSITGWVTLISSTIALGTVLWRANNKPVLDRLTALEHKFEAEVKRIEGVIDTAETARINAERRSALDLERTLVSFKSEVSQQVNGIGGRVDELKENMVFLSAQQVGFAERMVRSEEDRKQINMRQTEFATRQQQIINAIPELEIRINNSLHSQTKEILRELPHMIQQAILFQQQQTPKR